MLFNLVIPNRQKLFPQGCSRFCVGNDIPELDWTWFLWWFQLGLLGEGRPTKRDHTQMPAAFPWYSRTHWKSHCSDRCKYPDGSSLASSPKQQHRYLRTTPNTFTLGGIIFWINGSSFTLLPIHGKMGLAIRITSLHADLMEGFLQPADLGLKSSIDALQEADRFIDLSGGRGVEISVAVAGNGDALLPQSVDEFTELSSAQSQGVFQFLADLSVSTTLACCL